VNSGQEKPGIATDHCAQTTDHCNETHKPVRLDALTGLRFFAAINIVFFHFSNPQLFGFLAPVVNNGFIALGLFFLLSGFVLAYNYGGQAREGKLDKARFWKARFTRLYPVYLLSLLMSWRMVSAEYGAHAQPVYWKYTALTGQHGMFWVGMALTPLLLQGWFPTLATFLNTPAWAMPAEAFMYSLFPWLAKVKRPATVSRNLALLAVVWAVGMVPGALYMIIQPDGIAHPDRWSYGYWLWALKYTPLPHLASFVFGILLVGLDALVPRSSRLRLLLGVTGFAGVFILLEMGPMVPFVLLHDALLMPLFGCIVLGLAGENLLSAAFSFRPFVFLGEASYCLYILHFNLWNWIHETHLPERLGVARFDPWISFAALLAVAVAAMLLVEKPSQRQLRKRMGA
jgi:peptidoglycan/LPS O-acetylase OafA/YrhL